MSHKASAWAMDQKPGTPLEKLVLLILADCQNESSGQCYPSITYLCDKSMCSRRGAIKVIESLEEQGYITAKKTSGKVTHYLLHRDRTGEHSAPVKVPEDPDDLCTQFTSALSAPVHTVHGTSALSAPPPVHSVHPTRALSAPEPGINQEVNQEGTERESTPSRFPPEDFEPDQNFNSNHRELNPLADYERELRAFRLHEFNTPRSDWQRAWRKWWAGAKPVPRGTQSTSATNKIAGAGNAQDAWSEVVGLVSNAKQAPDRVTDPVINEVVQAACGGWNNLGRASARDLNDYGFRFRAAYQQAVSA